MYEVLKMKKLLLLAALLVPFFSVSADPRDHKDRDHHEWHERGGHFGWGEFVGGLVLGGIIAHEVNGNYYDTNENEVQRVSVCNNYPVIDQSGRYVYDQWDHMITERRCHDEWVRIGR